MLGAGGRHRGDEGGGNNALGPSWEGVTGMSGEGGSAWRRLNLDKGMGKNRGQARRTLKEEERGAVAQRATRGGGGLRTAAMARAQWRQAPVERRTSRRGEGGGAPGTWARPE
jgi:hypothetical protein